MPHGVPLSENAAHGALHPLAVGMRAHAVHAATLHATAPAALDFLAQPCAPSANALPPADPALDSRWPRLWLLDARQDPELSCHAARLSGVAHLALLPALVPGATPVEPADAGLLPVLGLPELRAWQDQWATPVLVDVRLLDPQGFGPGANSRAEQWAEAALLSGTRLVLDLHALLVHSLQRVELRARTQGQAVWPPNLMHEAEQVALDVVWSLPPGSVGLLALGGFQWPPEEATLPRLMRNHRVAPQGWTLFEAAIRHLGPLPTLLLWDSDLPPLAVLLDEVRLARQITQPLAQGDAMPFTDPWV